MWGRYTRTRDSIDYAALLGVDDVPSLPHSYNVAPTQPVLVGRVREGRPEAAVLSWGLVPSWSKDGRKRASRLTARPGGGTMPRFPGGAYCDEGV